MAGPIIMIIVVIVAALCSALLGKKNGVFAFVFLLICTVVVMSVSSGGNWAIFLMALGFGAPFLLVAAASGLIIGVLLKQKKVLLPLVLFTPFVYIVWSIHNAQTIEENEVPLALDFVEKNAQLAALAGGVLRPSIVTHSTGSSDGENYVIDIIGDEKYYAVVRSFRKSKGTEFKISCVTKVNDGNCADEQSVVSLPK
jgi:hypothetical protein